MKIPKVKSILHSHFVIAFKLAMSNDIDDPNFITERDPETSAERQLLIGLIDRAVRDAVERYCSVEDSIDAAKWFEGAYEDETDFTFREVCEYLDINADKFLEHIRPMYVDLLD